MASPLLVCGGGKNQCQWMYAWQFVGLLCVSVSSLLVSVKVGPLNYRKAIFWSLISDVNFIDEWNWLRDQ